MVVSIPWSVIRTSQSQYSQFLTQYASLTNYLYNKRHSIPQSIRESIPDKVLAEATRFTHDSETLQRIHYAVSQSLAYGSELEFVVNRGL